MVAKRKNNRREKMSSKGWSTSPLSVRVEELVSARIFFFSLSSGAGNFSAPVHALFFI